MAASDPTWGVPTPTGTLQGAAAFSWDGSAWQPSARAGPNVSTPTGVLRGVAPFGWSSGAWLPSGAAGPGVPTPSGTLDGIALFTWNGSAWTPPGGGPGCATPTGTLRGVAGFLWDGTAWQPSGQAGPRVATPTGALDGVALFNWTGSGWTPSLAPSLAPALDLSFMTPGSLDGRITFTRASTATYFDASGTMQTAAANAPRWDYDPFTHTLNGLLVEQVGTNLLLNSANLTTQSVTVTAVASALSFYGTGTITMSGAFAGTLVGTGPYPQRVWVGFTPTAGTLTLTVSGSVQNAQLEQIAILTSYIPTTGVAATRAVDSATMPTAPWYTSGTTLAVSLVADVMVPVGGGNFLQLDDATNANLMRLICQTGPFQGTSFAAEIVASVVNYNSSELGRIPFGPPFKMGYSTRSGAHQYALNGVASSVGNAATDPPPVTTLKLGRAVPATLGSFYLRRARYWPRALTTSELQAVTT